MSTFQLRRFRWAVALLLWHLGASLGTLAQPPGLQPVLLNPFVPFTSCRLRVVVPAGGGDFYIAGEFRNSLTLGTTPLHSLGEADMFVAKYSAQTGTFAWVEQFGGRAEEIVTGLVSRNNNLFVTGYFVSDTLRLGSQLLLNPPYNMYTTTDGFVLKLSDTGSRGQVVWAQQIGGPNDDRVDAVAVAGNRVYVGGCFTSASLGAGSLRLANSVQLPFFSATADGFVAALADAGPTVQPAWLHAVTGNGTEQVSSLAVSNAGLYVGGNRDNMSNGNSQFVNLPLAPSNWYNGFVGKLTDNGSTATGVWVEQLHDGGPAYRTKVAAHQSTVYVAGGFEENLVIGSDILATAGDHDVYVGRLDDAGPTATWAWGRQLGGDYYDVNHALTCDNQGVYCAGEFYGVLLHAGTTVLYNVRSPNGYPSGTDAYVSQLSATGDFLTTHHITGEGNATPVATAVADGQLYVAGTFSREVRFGTQSFVAAQENNIGFVATVPLLPLATRAATSRPGLALFPNPATGHTTLHLPANPTATPFAITFTDALGRVVQRREVTVAGAGQSIVLDLAALVPGVYAVRVQQGAAQAVQRLVVE
ncbi:T9SS type A sorting domain-containing protein [Hymenobacter sp. ASUV-10]|uniref:T9SS type A sorting domain-containing protein n=1 Tax=Hymenobacter aranciens TaxID=3063996 RepID=A0ABT9BBG6_9BACT|nr:T9SS type A sorting domain-containing protein [Hymenobacter sp. ASUV-10]MDO7875601.1 T9SS type A sorting domain-containing protein [Hymenobacter sp. ASUV-10]